MGDFAIVGVAYIFISVLVGFALLMWYLTNDILKITWLVAISTIIFLPGFLLIGVAFFGCLLGESAANALNKPIWKGENDGQE